MSALVLSEATDPINWSDTLQYAQTYGVKGATSLTIPRAWTLPFGLISVDLAAQLASGNVPDGLIRGNGPGQLAALAGKDGQLIVRSSVVGESIWDRGSYVSVPIAFTATIEDTLRLLVEAAQRVLASTEGRPTGIMLQRYLRPAAQGEFGNLQRISKTRDQWEVATLEPDGVTARLRLNSQRDRAADPETSLAARVGLTRERLFGSVGAWLNNELLLGQSQRLNCEWISDNRQFYLVQIDEEDEDTAGVNPFQLRVGPTICPLASNGKFLKLAEQSSLSKWDKLKVLEELWEPGATHRPTLFFLPLADLPRETTDEAVQNLTTDFLELIGSRGIVVRTSVRAEDEKLFNLPRTECLDPVAAAEWCFATASYLKEQHKIDNLAFIAHRFVAAQASAWARATPDNPIVEINSLWGLPDALQYCPYDIWEVHVPTGTATSYPDYKSDMLVPRADGGWEYVRVKNELARANSISSVEAKDIANRSAYIAGRLGKPCHIMWFVGCVDEGGTPFNIPWYWTEAHQAERNPDRTAYRVFTVSDKQSLAQFVDFPGSRVRQALALRPTDLDLMRNNSFIEAVGRAASAVHVPVILNGSTLAHAYYQLRKLGCTVVTPSEKEHARVRHAMSFGKLVRDKIPGRIAERRETHLTRQVDGGLRKAFLVSKLLEEALEVREAREPTEKVEELADLLEVVRAIAKVEGISIKAVVQAADDKNKKSGGFEEGLVLLQTAITASDRSGGETERAMEVLGDSVVDDTAEVPFSFFGFMELDQVKSIYFEALGVRAELILRPDRLEIKLFQAQQQLVLPL